MAGCMDDLGGIAVEADEQAVAEVFVRRSGFGSINAEPTGLFSHDFELGQVVFIHEDGGTGELFEFEGAADVVDVGVGDENLLELEAEGVEAASDAADFVAGIDDDGFASFLVSQDGAVALQRANGEGFEDHGFILGYGQKRRVMCQVAHLPFPVPTVTHAVENRNESKILMDDSSQAQ